MEELFTHFLREGKNLPSRKKCAKEIQILNFFRSIIVFSLIELATRHPALRVERSRRQCNGSDGSLGKVFRSLGEGSSFLRRPWSSQQQQHSRYAAAVKSHAVAGEWPRARMHKAHAPQRRHKTTAQLSIYVRQNSPFT